MEKFIERSESLIKFWILKVGLCAVLLCSAALVVPGMPDRMGEAMYGEGLAGWRSSAASAVVLLMALGPMAFEGFMCYRAYSQAETSVNSIRTDEEMEIFRQQKFFLKYIPLGALGLLFIPVSHTLSLFISVLFVCSKFVFYKNHRILKFLFNL